MQEEFSQLFDTVSEEETRSRIKAFRERMYQRSIDYALVQVNVNLFYFTGTLQRGILLIPLRGEPGLLIQKAVERAELESPFPVRELKSMKQLPDHIRDMGLAAASRVGLELQEVPAALFEKLRTLLGAGECVNISEDLLRVRSRKSPYEMEQIKRSAALTEKVFSAVPDCLREGMKEIELAAALQAEGRIAGHQEIMRMRGFNQELTNPHVLAGTSAAAPSFADVPLAGYGTTAAVAQGASHRRIARKEPVIVDYGGGYNGYMTDETRSFALGGLESELVRAHTAAMEVAEYVERNSGPGVSCRELYWEAVGIAEREGLGEHFMGYGRHRVRFVGHGIGLYINEYPLIGDVEDTLEEGMVFAVEPKFVFPDKGAVGVEIDLRVTENGAQRLTGTPLDVVYC
ncbi:MAG: Xaa-Pro peptidase family protein [Desulfohalobiaceae bacterium]|nr:Xaa-Pro peptidase family protein [Desulfohalobiaceae bacterium]